PSELSSGLVELNCTAASITTPWGTLAAEVFPLEKWDQSASEAPNEQRKALRRKYINLGHQESQISTILAPLRTVSQRKFAQQREIAYRGGEIGTAWLRTDYSAGTDDQHEQLMSDTDVENAVGSDDSLLNDADLHSFGDGWQRVFVVLPKLLYPTMDMLDSDLVRFLAHIERLIAITQRNSSLGRREEEVFNIVHTPVQKAHVVNYLIVEDKEAPESGEILVVFVDDLEQVVRKDRVDAGKVEDSGGLWMQSAYDDTVTWMKGGVGVDYAIGGARGPPYLLE
ncbi:hypothetical protein AOQ84DRAFT_408041, partial [Glonium stellatum]